MLIRTLAGKSDRVAGVTRLDVHLATLIYININPT